MGLIVSHVSEELPGVQIEEPKIGTTTRPPWLPLKPPSPRTPPPKVAPFDLPTFDHSQVINVSTQLGDTAFLNCRVRTVNEKAVSLNLTLLGLPVLLNTINL